MAGVNRAAVAVTDTFDVWRVRTNELNTSLNAGTSANTADTIVWRGDSGEIDVATLSANTVTLARASDAPTITIASALDGSATTGSFTTTGGIKVDRASYFGQGLTVVGNLVTNGSTTLGNSGATDTITLTGRVNTTLENATSISYDIGSTTRLWKTYYGQGINLTANTTIAADSTLKITSGHVTKPSFKIVDAVSAGVSAQLVNITSTSTDTAARDLAVIHNDNAAAVGASALHLKSDSGRGLKITSSLVANGQLPSLEIASSHKTSDASLITASSLTTGKAFHVTSAGATRTGHMVHLASTNTGAGSTGDVLHVVASTSSNTAMIANFANATTNVVSIAVGGSVKINGDLEVTGATSQFSASSSIVNDKTLVLGAAGDVVANCAHTNSNPAVVTSTTHGLVTNDVIFIINRTGNTLTPAYSETVVKIVKIDNNSFTLKSIAGVPISGVPGAGTLSYTGKQLESTIDDAGIYIPGTEDVHRLKWDSDDKYWEFNDSLKIDTATQLVVPKGTAAQQPAASVQVVNNKSVAAATTGAMRFNTTSNYFEGVNAGTTFEAFATQNFSTAIAVALG